ncbi:DUF6350 family protein [Streptomyces sp. NPDC046985]|uniref:cell division protein PerM n=1 Tax=Streptomyces sp. NPDC046985 TaxID=3155377 RepID=UPI0033E10D2C
MADVIQTTRQRPPLPQLRTRVRDRSPGLGAGCLGGMVAAGLGLGSFAVLVVVLWISSPYPDSGPSGALHVAAALWLLSHGAELVRTDTLSGVPAPVGVIPLALLAAPAALIHRAARDATDAGDAGPLAPARLSWAGIVLGYLTVAGGAAAYAADGVLRPSWLWTALWLPTTTATAAASGVWAAYGCPRGPLEKLTGPLPSGVRRLLLAPGPRARLGASSRAAAAGAAVFAGGGALVLGASLVAHSASVQEAFPRLTEGWSGRFAVLLLCLALLPNAVVWAAAYALGPGFVLGAGHVVGPLSSAPSPQLPDLPLLAAVPDAGPGGALHWAAAAVPAAAGLTIGWFVGTAAVREVRDAGGAGGGAGGRTGAGPGAGPKRAWSWRRTSAGAGLGCLLCALVLGAVAQGAGGPLGNDALSRFGPVGWQVTAAALLGTATTAVPTALLVRAWRYWGRRALSAEAIRQVVAKFRAGRAQAAELPAPGVRPAERYDSALESYDMLPLEALPLDPRTPGSAPPGPDAPGPDEDAAQRATAGVPAAPEQHPYAAAADEAENAEGASDYGDRTFGASPDAERSPGDRRSRSDAEPPPGDGERPRGDAERSPRTERAPEGDRPPSPRPEPAQPATAPPRPTRPPAAEPPQPPPTGVPPAL